MNKSFKFGESSQPKKTVQEKPKPTIPKEAKDIDPYGNPYFGEGLGGMLKKWKYNFTKDVKKVDDAEWQELKDRWTAAGNSYTTGSTEEKNAAVREQASIAGEAIGAGWRSVTSEKQSPLTPVLKGVGASVGLLADLFSIPAQKTEQAIGAAQGFQEAANEVDSILPRLDDNSITRFLEDFTPLGAAYDFARLALSPSANKWDVAEKRIEEGWQSGRIMYSQIFDKTLKEQFLREYRAGGDPALIAMRLQNPLAELGGQLLLDPLNFAGLLIKGGKTAQQLQKAEEALTSSGLLKIQKGAEALKAIESAQDEVTAIKAADILVDAQREAIAVVKGQSKTLKVGYGISDLTTSSRQNSYIGRSKDHLNMLANSLKAQGMSNDNVVEAIFYGIKSVSDKSDEMREGLAAISHMPSANLWLSDQSIETFTVMKNLMADTDGTINGARLAGLMKAKNPAEFGEAAEKLLRTAAQYEFPAVDELAEAVQLVKTATKEGGTVSQKTIQMAKAYEELPNHVKALNKIDQKLSKYVKNPINRILSPMYFNWQGGVAVKNVATNSELILIDQGVKAWMKDGKYWSLEKVDGFLKDVFGEIPSSAHGFESLVVSGGGKSATVGLNEIEAAKGVIEKAKVIAKGFKESQFGLIMETGEAAAARRVVGASVRDTFKKMLQPGAALLDASADVEKGVIKQAQVSKLNQLVYKHNGNITKAIEEFRDLYKTGAVDVWRNLDFITPLQRGALENMDLLDDIEDLARMGATSPADVEKVFEKLNKVIDTRAGMAVDDVIGLNPDHVGAESWGDLMKAVEDGMLNPNDEKVFTALMEAAEQARMQYSDLLDDVTLKAQDALSRNGDLQGAQHIGQEMNRVRGKLRQAGPATAKEARTLTNEAWVKTKEIRALKNPSREELTKLWTRYGMMNAAPVDITKQEFLSALWKETHSKTKDVWGAMLDTVVGESETVLQQIGKVVDTTEIQSMAARTRNITQQAQAIRSAVFEGGRLRVASQKSIFDIAKDYGIASATKTGKQKDAALLAIINKYGGVEYKNAGKIQQSVKIEAAIGDNPLTLLKQKGGVNLAEFSDVMGGTAGVDKAGVIPGLFKKDGMGIDEAGRMLADYGYITPQQAEDANFVRDFIRNPKGRGGVVQEELFDNTAPFFDENGKLQNVPKDWKYTSLDEVPNDVIRKAFDNQRQAHGLPPLETPKDMVAIPAMHPDGTQPTLPRAWNENAKGMKYVLDTVKNDILKRWGRMEEGAKASPELDAFLRRYAEHAVPRIAETKAIAMRVADENRKFTLLNYGERTYGDIALSYIMPYHFFYTKSYKNWISRIAQNPQIVAGYAKYKRALEDINKDLPPWYKQQLDVTKLLGIQTDHPLFFNLEASFNPLYGLTGTDFNDPEKRTNWVTSTFDDLGKFGPTLWAPIQMAIAAKLYHDGQTDAASRWGNRIFPQTAQVKAVSSFFGKPIELDPAVNFFSDGIDPYERGRMGYAAAQLIESKKYTAEEVQAQFQEQAGPAWDEAYQIAVNNRAPSSISSYFLGVGFKPRSTTDVKVEEMYTKLNQLYALSDTMNKDAYRQKWEELRQSYPPGFVDTVLLAKKGGDKRDAAYAYNVLGRLPPGEMNDVFKALGINQQDVNKFYDSKGFTDKTVTWTKTEKQRFMAAIVDMGVMIKIPDDTTQGEWSKAKTTYNQILADVQTKLGEDIWEKVSHYYDLKDDNYQEAVTFKEAHPEINEALQMKQAMIVADPDVSVYYGGLDVIEAYVNGQVREQLSKKFGAEIYDKQTEYFNIKVSDTKAAKQYLNEHPELKKFWEEKAVLDDAGMQMFVNIGGMLPEKAGSQIQEGFTPQSGAQQAILDQLQTPPTPSFDELVNATQGDMSPAMQTIVQAYWASGEPLTAAATNQLDYLASRYGAAYGATTGDDFLRLAGLALQKAPTQVTQETKQPGFHFSQ